MSLFLIKLVLSRPSSNGFSSGDRTMYDKFILSPILVKNHFKTKYCWERKGWGIVPFVTTPLKEHFFVFSQ